MIVLKDNPRQSLSVLQSVSGIVERRHTLPILANVLIRKTGGACSSPPATSKSRSAPPLRLDGDTGNFTTTVGARKLIDILRTMPATRPSCWSRAAQADPQGAAKASSRCRPCLPKTSAGAGIRQLRADRSACRKDPQGPARPGVVRDGGARHPLLPQRHPVRGRRQTLSLVATDGHRLAFASATLDVEVPQAGSHPAAQDRDRDAAPAPATPTAPSIRCSSPTTRPNSAFGGMGSSPSWSRASSPTTTA